MLDRGVVDRILARYPHASPLVRWHMRGRLRLCPYDGLLKHLTGKGDLLDIGCGFGHFAWYLAEAMPSLRYFGTDIDARKVDLALGSLSSLKGAAADAGGSSARLPAFRPGDIMAMEDWSGPYGNITLLDVTYLMPWEFQTRLLTWALGRLAPGPDSALIIKTMDAPEGWSGRRALWEEWIMVHLLGRTKSSGTINGTRPFATYIAFAHGLGFECEVEAMGTFNPSSVLRFHRQA